MNHRNGDVRSAGDAATTSWLSHHRSRVRLLGSNEIFDNDNRDSSSQRQRRPPAENEEMATKAQNLMTERFGLNCPEIRAPQQQSNPLQPPPQQQSPQHDDSGDYGEGAALIGVMPPILQPNECGSLKNPGTDTIVILDGLPPSS
jgi:hypothetical protein